MDLAAETAPVRLGAGAGGGEVMTSRARRPPLEIS